MMPLWTILPTLYEKYWNRERVACITSTLATPLNGQFANRKLGEAMESRRVIVIDVKYKFPNTTMIIIEGRREDVIEEIEVESPPPQLTSN